MISVEDWAEIRRLHRSDHLSIKEISRRLGLARNTVRAALRAEGPPSYERARRPWAVDAVEPEIRALLQQFPRMPATVIAERIGWSRSLTQLKLRVSELRPLYLPPDPVQRTNYVPGELAQWDLWFPPADIPVGVDQVARPPVLVGVSGYSRWMVGHMIPSRQTHDILCGHLRLLVDLGGVPRSGVYDNEPGLISRRGGSAKPTRDFDAFRGTLGMGVIALRPADPEAKGLVERANGYLETSFLPGRRFSDPADFNAQLAQWLEKANRRQHRALRCRPLDRIADDRRAMAGFPPVLPDPALRFSTRLGRDHHVRVATCDYSVHPKAIGRRVEVRVDLERVLVRLGAEVVADHERSWARHRTLTDPRHVEARAVMALNRALSEVATDDDQVEERDLSVYDRALGVA